MKRAWWVRDQEIRDRILYSFWCAGIYYVGKYFIKRRDLLNFDYVCEQIWAERNFLSKIKKHRG